MIYKYNNIQSSKVTNQSHSFVNGKPKTIFLVYKEHSVPQNHKSQIPNKTYVKVHYPQHPLNKKTFKFLKPSS